MALATYYLATNVDGLIVEVRPRRAPRALRAEVGPSGGWLACTLAAKALRLARAEAQREGATVDERRMWAGDVTPIKRPPGRPPLPDGEGFTVPLRARISEEQAAKIDRMGERSEVIRRLIDQA